ncbi:MAG: DUF4412 domain-containing protein [Desulfobacteraceae bacterium]|nr:MAG: DUF4412 domain-containing protein [Desulfobacteraceae bacterium]
MKKYGIADRWLVSFVTVTLFFFVSPWVFAGKVKEFSADQVHIDASGKVDNSGKLFFTEGKMRIEGMNIQGPRRGGQTDMIVIVRKDLKLHRMLNPKKKAYFERGIDEREMASFSGQFKKGDEKDLGTETIQGYKCRKKQVTTSFEMMGYKQTIQSIQWVSEEFPMPLRTQNQDGSATELRNIKEGNQSAELFEVPSDYTQVSDLFELMEEPSEKRSRKRQHQGEDSGKGGFNLPEGAKKYLPKGFKMPGSGE